MEVLSSNLKRFLKGQYEGIYYLIPQDLINQKRIIYSSCTPIQKMSPSIVTLPYLNIPRRVKASNGISQPSTHTGAFILPTNRAHCLIWKFICTIVDIAYLFSWWCPVFPGPFIMIRLWRRRPREEPPVELHFCLFPPLSLPYSSSQCIWRCATFFWS